VSQPGWSARVWLGVGSVRKILRVLVLIRTRIVTSCTESTSLAVARSDRPQREKGPRCLGTSLCGRSAQPVTPRVPDLDGNRRSIETLLVLTQVDVGICGSLLRASRTLILHTLSSPRLTISTHSPARSARANVERTPRDRDAHRGGAESGVCTVPPFCLSRTQA
jgi:hypothetical protein